MQFLIVGDTVEEEVMVATRHTLLVFTYFAFIIAISVPPSVLTSVRNDIGFTTGDAATIVAFKTFGWAIGKVFWGGWPADFLGPSRAFMLSIGLIGISILGFAFAKSLISVGFWLVLLDVVSTPVYPSHVLMIRAWFDPKLHGFSLWLLGLSSRMGVLLSRIVFGILVDSTPSWRTVVIVALGINTLGLAVGGLFHQDSPQVSRIPIVTPSCTAIKTIVIKLITSWNFWICLNAYTWVTILKRMNEQLVAVYIFDTASNIDEGQASQLASVWTAGLVISVLVGGRLYTSATTQSRKVRIVFIMCMMSIIGCIGLIFWSSETATLLSLVIRLIFILITASGLGVVYYITPFMFCIHFGGESAGVVSGVLDGLGGVVTGIFINSTHGIIDGRWGWEGVWIGLTIVAILNCISNVYFVRRQLQAEEENVAFTRVKLEFASPKTYSDFHHNSSSSNLEHDDEKIQY